MTTDTTEKGLETLIMRHMTGTDGLFSGTGDGEAHRGKKFAIIIDEAHSSQGGRTALSKETDPNKLHTLKGDLRSMRPNRSTPWWLSIWMAQTATSWTPFLTPVWQFM